MTRTRVPARMRHPRFAADRKRGEMREKTEAPAPDPWIRRVLPPLAGLRFTGQATSARASVVVLARDEERCIARCLDSVVSSGFDDVLVVDTGSVDGTPGIVATYADRGVRLLHVPWSDSFAEARNAAIDAVGDGWVVFLDADEWVESGEELRTCLDSLTGAEGLRRLVFAPRIFDVDREAYDDSIPRIFLADGGVRFKGEIHEYPVVAGEVDEPVGLVELDVVLRHDGYRPDVVHAKGKRQRNLELLRAALKNDPANPRWFYFMIRDALPVLGGDQIVGLCDALRDLVGRDTGSGDLLGAAEYWKLALAFSCQGLVALGDWDSVHRFCRDLDQADAHYFSTMAELVGGVVTKKDLLRAVEIRKNDDLVARSAIDPSGRHVDALICALLGRLRGEDEADRYRELCDPWDDVFFEKSMPRGAAGISPA
ncbi:glycosyltransferase family 2 protein [Lentzea sp. CA-135723]|uniref:glycosyltransferase family 2 protein n=1 Tax=Lentzea sp. CA-135723 TaxID=3239950 RepID=UPI003D90FF2E